jgi:predicted transcriptional regulator
MATTFTVKEVAEKLGTDARTLRKFFRAEATEKGGKIGEDTPGKGGRYSIEARQVPSLNKRFAAWSAAHTRTADENEDAETDEVEADDELEAE